MLIRLLAATFMLSLSCGAGLAQSCFPDAAGTHVNCGVPMMYLNNGISVAVDATHGIPTTGVEQADVTGTFTNATQTNSVTSTSQDGFGTALVSINGTYAGAAGVFELSDDNGVTWSLMSVARSDGSGSETGYTALTNLTRAWIIPVAGIDLIRIRSTAVTSGTVNVRISSTSVQTSPIPIVTTPLTGSGTGSTGAISATLTAVANKTTYICGFNYQGSDATAAVAGNIAVSGTITGTMNFGYVSLAAGPTVPQPPPVPQAFTPCVPASGTGVNIVVTPPTLGAGATIATVSAWGFNQ